MQRTEPVQCFLVSGCSAIKARKVRMGNDVTQYQHNGDRGGCSTCRYGGDIFPTYETHDEMAGGLGWARVTFGAFLSTRLPS
ncbi:uncharacterized protein LAJ45_09231 [Morchella importuna]|uniref:uncharacterized protein n=1 Tax=Morchella importuna TaxID=1174673 RepID=UPI001E8D3805|nr:uncharacterized protein LAJ45_09231 [Morchella importuna]KAH8146857.1 hypothetical protein LAJ45_09231 [Morchella importuna]